MRQCTLLVDGNWLLMSRSSMNRDGFLKTNADFEKELAMNDTVDLMSKSIVLVLNRFDGIINNVILCVDGHSWRKDIEKPSYLEAEYKGTRVKDDTLDWEYIYKSLNILEDSCRDLGITVSHSKNAEGDDAIMYWSKILNEEGVNTIIWSSDNDLKQLVQGDSKAWTIWYNDRYGLFGDKRMFAENEIDMFMQSPEITAHQLLFEQMQHMANLEMTLINPEDIVMEKIICGDSSDNIKAVVRIKSKSKEYKVTAKMWEKVKEELSIQNLNDFFKQKETIIENLYGLKKFIGTSMTIENAQEQFDYNTRLVWLELNQLPSEVLYNLDLIEYKDFDIESIKNNYKTLYGQGSDEIIALADF